jgi:hypothetical protein
VDGIPCKLIPIDVEVGDRIFFSKWWDAEVTSDGVEDLITKENGVAAVLLDEKSHKKRPMTLHATHVYDPRYL